MFSHLNWSTRLSRVRQLWTLVAADAERMGQDLASIAVSMQQIWDNKGYAPNYALVRVERQRRYRR